MCFGDRVPSSAQVEAEAEVGRRNFKVVPFTVKNTFVDVAANGHDSDEEQDFAVWDVSGSLRRLVSEPAKLPKREADSSPRCIHTVSTIDEQPPLLLQEDDDSFDDSLNRQCWARLTTGEAWNDASSEDESLSYQSTGQSAGSIDVERLTGGTQDGSAATATLSLNQHIPDGSATWVPYSTEQPSSTNHSSTDTSSNSSNGHSSCGSAAALSSVTNSASSWTGCYLSSKTATTTKSKTRVAKDVLSAPPADWVQVRSVMMHNVPLDCSPQMLLEEFAEAGFGMAVVSARRLRPYEETVRVEFTSSEQSWYFKLAFEGRRLACSSAGDSAECLVVSPCQSIRSLKSQHSSKAEPLVPGPLPQTPTQLVTHRRNRRGMGSLIDQAKEAKAKEQQLREESQRECAAAPGPVAVMPQPMMEKPKPTGPKVQYCPACSAKCKASFKFCSFCGAAMRGAGQYQ